MSDGPMKPQLWTPRPVAETVEVYRDWAGTYDADIGARGYATPGRIAQALSERVPLDTPILDFGCGTGLSGLALRKAGFTRIDGTDITDAMVAEAEKKGIYNKLWVSEPGQQPAAPGHYGAIVAAGVISLGAAPPEALGPLGLAVARGDLIVLSFNDPTLENGTYDAYLNRSIADGLFKQLSRIHGPHLEDMGMGSDVIVLERL